MPFLAAVSIPGAGPLPAVGAPAATAGPQPPNVLIVLSDDQPPSSFPYAGTPLAMPWLEGRVADPADHWVNFSRAFVNEPVCCPSRATLLSGRYAHHTGVTSNKNGDQFDESQTLATWLDGAGYRTGYIGKYLNGWPFDRSPYTPQGWDRAVLFKGAKYYQYTLYVDGPLVPFGKEVADYSTDVLAGYALDFVRTAPTDSPFFLVYAPLAPHYPHTPAQRHKTVFNDERQPPRPASLNEADVSDKPAWVRALPLLDAPTKQRYDQYRSSSYEAMIAVDEAMQQLVDAIDDRGQLSNTLILFMTDNGFLYGEHRTKGKFSAYEESVRVPFAMRWEAAAPHTENRLVSNVDVASTVLAAAGVQPTLAQDGISLVPLLGSSPPSSWRQDVLLEKRSGGVGDTGEKVPAYWGLRTKAYTYVEYDTGEVELYDMTGALGPADPLQMKNRCPDPNTGDGVPAFRCVSPYASVQAQLSARLDELKAS